MTGVESAYSERRASTGSTEAARTAGMLTASRVTRMSAAMEIASETGSVALVWKSRPLMRRAPRKPARRPAQIPIAVELAAWRRMSCRMSPAIGADGHTDADFAGALGHGVGEHAEGSDGGEHKRDEREGAEEGGRHALASDRVRENGVDGFDVIDGLGGVGGEDGVADERCSGVGSERGANKQDGVKAESGEVNLGFGLGVDAEIAGIGNDANDGNLCWEWDS